MIANPTLGQQAGVDYSRGDGIGVVRRTSGLLGAAGVTMGLLFAMTQLISSDLPELEEEKAPPVIEFSFVPKDTPPEPTRLEPLEEVAPPPVRLTPQYSTKQDIDSGGISLRIPVDKGLGDIGRTIGLPGGGTLIPISPQYPEKAARAGICGEVLVQYDIDTQGIPVNVAILSSSHRYFDKEAARAVGRARYKPNIEGGQPAMVYGKQEKITFKLEGGCG